MREEDAEGAALQCARERAAEGSAKRTAMRAPGRRVGKVEMRRWRAAQRAERNRNVGRGVRIDGGTVGQ